MKLLSLAYPILHWARHGPVYQRACLAWQRVGSIKCTGLSSAYLLVNSSPFRLRSRSASSLGLEISIKVLSVHVSPGQRVVLVMSCHVLSCPPSVSLPGLALVVGVSTRSLAPMPMLAIELVCSTSVVTLEQVFRLWSG